MTTPASQQWCQPTDNGKSLPRKFIVRFDDAEMSDAVFDDETEAREFWNRAKDNWSCYLFGTLPVNPVTSADAEFKRLVDAFEKASLCETACFGVQDIYMHKAEIARDAARAALTAYHTAKVKAAYEAAELEAYRKKLGIPGSQWDKCCDEIAAAIRTRAQR